MDVRLNHNALCILALLLESKGKPCSVREIAAGTGLSINGVHVHLLRLRRLGLVAWQNDLARTLVPLCQWRRE